MSCHIWLLHNGMQVKCLPGSPWVNNSRVPFGEYLEVPGVTLFVDIALALHLYTQSEDVVRSYTIIPTLQHIQTITYQCKLQAIDFDLAYKAKAALVCSAGNRVIACFKPKYT